MAHSGQNRFAFGPGLVGALCHQGDPERGGEVQCIHFVEDAPFWFRRVGDVSLRVVLWRCPAFAVFGVADEGCGLLVHESALS